MRAQRSVIRVALGAFLFVHGPTAVGSDAIGARKPVANGHAKETSDLQGALAELASGRRTARDPRSWITDASIFIRNALTTAHGLNAEQTLQVQTPKVLGDQARYLAASAGRAAGDLRSLLEIARSGKPSAVPAIQAAMRSLQAAQGNARTIVANAARGILAPGNPAMIRTALGKLEEASDKLNAVILAYHLPAFVMRRLEVYPGHQQAGVSAPDTAMPSTGPSPPPSGPPAPSTFQPRAPSSESGAFHPQASAEIEPQEAYADIQITLSIRRARGTVEFATDLISVKSGQIVALTLVNSDSRESHNWVLIKPGRFDAVLALGSAAGVNPGDDEYEPDVLAKSGIVSPGGQYTVFFIAPHRPGLYPFVSTIGNESVRASGFLKVRKIG